MRILSLLATLRTHKAEAATFLLSLVKWSASSVAQMQALAKGLAA
jgi:hypothetical protein